MICLIFYSIFNSPSPRPRMSNFNVLPLYKPNTIFGWASAEVTRTYMGETRVAVTNERAGIFTVIIADFLTIALLMCSVMSMNMWLMLLAIMFATVLSRVLLNATVLAEFNPDHYALTIIEVVWWLCTRSN